MASTSISQRTPAKLATFPGITGLERLGVFLVMLLLGMMTVPFLGQKGLWSDEIFSAEIAHTWKGMFHVFALYENNMALYYVLLRIWMIFGDSDFFIRLFSVVFALMTVPVFHLLARRLFDIRTALIGDVLLVSNHFFLRYATEARCYSMLVFLTALASLLFIMGMQLPRYRTWIGYALVVAAATYTHYFGILIAGVHATALLWRNRPMTPWRHTLVALGLLLALLLPLAVFRPAASSGQLDWVSRPGSGTLHYFALDLAGGKAAAAITVICFAFLAALLSFRRSSMSSRQGWYIWFAVVWLVAPVAVTFIFSLLVKPVFVARYLIWCFPALVLILALAISQLSNWAAVGTLVVMFAFSLRQSIREGFTHGAYWREAAQYIRTHAASGDAVICYPFYRTTSLAYYLRRDAAPESMIPLNIAGGPYSPGGAGRDPDPAMDFISRLGDERPRVWLVKIPSLSKGLNRGWGPKIEAELDARLHRKSHFRYDSDTNGEEIGIICFERTAVASP